MKRSLLLNQKRRAFKYLYEFTRNACQDCAKTDCACKDSICAHVQTQLRVQNIDLPETGRHLRFLGCHGCVVPPHLRETCTIYLCENAQTQKDFDSGKYERLRNLCARIEERLMQLEV